MRIYWNNQSRNKTEHRISEYKDINIVPGWREDRNFDDIPDILSISLDYEYVGEYKFTYDMYDECLKNYTDVLNKLITNGWCYESDFKNVEWY